MASCLRDAYIPSTAAALAWEEKVGFKSCLSQIWSGFISTLVRDSWPLLYLSTETGVLRCGGPVCIKHAWYLQDASPKCQQCFSVYSTWALLRVFCCYFKFCEPLQRNRDQVKFLFSFALSLTHLFPLVRSLSLALLEAKFHPGGRCEKAYLCVEREITSKPEHFWMSRCTFTHTASRCLTTSTHCPVSLSSLKV